MHVEPAEPDPRIDTVLSLLGELTFQGEIMALNFDTLTNEVAESGDAQQSAITLIQAIATELAAAAGDQARVDELAAQLSSTTDALAAAVVANTPAAPTEPTEPPAEPVEGEPGF